MRHNQETYSLLNLREYLRISLGVIIDPKFNSWWKTQTGYLTLVGPVSFLINEILPWASSLDNLSAEKRVLAIHPNEDKPFREFVSCFESLLAGVERVGKFEFQLVEDQKWTKVQSHARVLEELLNSTHMVADGRDTTHFHVGISMEFYNEQQDPDPNYLQVLTSLLDLYCEDEYPIWYPRAENARYLMQKPGNPVLANREFKKYFIDSMSYPSYYAFAKDESHSVYVHTEEAECFIEFSFPNSKLEMIEAFIASIEGHSTGLWAWNDEKKLVPYSFE